MQRWVVALLTSFALSSSAMAAALPKDAKLGVIDAIAPHLSAGFGKAADAARAPTVKDQWQLGEIARDQAIVRLKEQGYRADAVTFPADLARVVRDGGAFEVQGSYVKLAAAFGNDLDQWLKAQKLDGVVVLRSLARPLAKDEPPQSGYGIARRAAAPVVYANLAPVLLTGSPPTIAGAPQCLVSAPVDAALIDKPTSLQELAVLRPALESVLRQSVDGALIRAKVMPGDAACE